MTLNNDVEIKALVPSISHLSLNIFTALPEASILNTWELTAAKTHTYNCFFPQFSRTTHKQFFNVRMFTDCDMETWWAAQRKMDFLL